MIVNTVLVIVIFTIVLLTSLLETFSRSVGLKQSEEEMMISNYIIDKEKS